MDWGTFLLLAASSAIFQSGIDPNYLKEASYFTVQWHYLYTRVLGTTSPETKAAFYNSTLKIFYLGKEAETTNLYEFQGPKTSLLGLNSRIDGLIYDENSGQVHTNLSAIYPQLIGVNSLDAYLLKDPQWVQSCTDCINSNITSSNGEIFLSHDKTFWASFDDSRRIITSKDFRQWTPCGGNPDSNSLRNIFPILNSKSEQKWVLVYLNTVSPDYSYYSYDVGTVSFESGFNKELGPFNLTCGQVSLDLFFATKGDNVDQFQYLIPTSINVIDGNSTTPVILNTPRQVMFKEISGRDVLVQQPLLTADKIGIESYRHSLANTQFGYGIQGNIIGGISSTSFIMTAELKLDNSEEVGVFIRMSQDQSQRTGIGYLAEGVFYVGIDKNPQSQSNGTVLNTFSKSFEAKLTPTVPSGNPTFLIYLDGPLLEVFCDNRQVNFNLIVLAKRDSSRMGLYTSINSTATVIAIDIVTY